MSLKIIRAIILGAPGSGKGTISDRIVKNFGFVPIPSGDILRTNIQNRTSLGTKVQSYMEQGHLVPDDLIIKCVIARIFEINNCSYLLDGFPRTLEQAKKLQSIESIDVVINLKVPDDVILERVRGRWIHLPSGRVYNVNFNAPKIPFTDDVTGEKLVQRPDDQPETVKKRLKIYETCTKPVIEFYKKYNLVYEFSGKTTNEIWPKIHEFLCEKTKKIMIDSV